MKTRSSSTSQRAGTADPSDYTHLSRIPKKSSVKGTAPATKSVTTSELEDERSDTPAFFDAEEEPRFEQFENMVLGRTEGAGPSTEGVEQPQASSSRRDTRIDGGEQPQQSSSRREVRTETSTSAANKKLINPRAREAPRFDASKPAELTRFLREMDNALDEAGITSNTFKKTNVGRFTDAETQAQWENIPRFNQISWEEFKTRLLETYPEAETAKRGAISRLEKICKRNKGISEADTEELARFTREFTAESNKLLARGSTSHRELIDMVRGCLDKSFARSVWMQLKTRLMQSDHPSDDDQIKVNDYLELAMKLSYGSRRYEHAQEDDDSDYDRVEVKKLKGSTTSSKLPEIKLEDTKQWGEMTHTLNAQMDKMKAMENSFVNLHGATAQRMEDIMREIKALKAVPQYSTTHEQQGTRGSNANPSSSGFRPMGPCFFCGEEGHMISACATKNAYIAKGLVKPTDVGLRMANGSPIPTVPGIGPNERTMKDRVDAALAKKQNFLSDPSTTVSGFYNVTQEDFDAYAQQSYFQGNGGYNDYQSQMVNLLNENRILRSMQQQPVQPGYYNGMSSNYLPLQMQQQLQPQMQFQSQMWGAPPMQSSSQQQMYGMPYNGFNSGMVQPTPARFTPQQPMYGQNAMNVNVPVMPQVQQPQYAQQPVVEDPMAARIAQLEKMLSQMASTPNNQSQQSVNENGATQSGF